MRDPNDPCLFCNSKESGIIIKNHLAYASYDTYPVSKYHCLIIPKRHMKNFFDLTNEELSFNTKKTWRCGESTRRSKISNSSQATL